MWILNIILLIFILGILILAHEFGHFITAKKTGVHIYEFAIGMGPVIWKKIGKDGIQYSLRAFPIGGYVQMAGEVSEDDDEIPKEKFMCNKTGWQRFLVLIAGVVFNFILAFLILFISALIWGSGGIEPKIGAVAEGYPVDEAGIVPGDRITEINGYKVNTWDKAQIVLSLKHKGAYEFVVEHENGTKEKYEITPVKEETEDGEERTVFGLSIDQTVNRGLFDSLKYAFQKMGALINSMVMVIGNLFTGKLALSALSGPVGIYSVVGAASSAGIQSVLYIVAFLSINLGFINALPFPAFDGGRILFLIIEKIKGSPVNSKLENIFHTIGFILLIILMIYITFQDILRFF